MVDMNDPETKREYDAYLEHEKHESIDEKVQDVANREPPWIWAIVLFVALATLEIARRLFS